MPRLSLAQQFLLASLVVVVAGALIVGWWVGKQVQREALTRVASTAGLYVDSVLAADLQPLAANPQLDDATIGRLDQLMSGPSLGGRIATFKVWSTDGRVLYSPSRELIGRQFELDPELHESLEGKLTADVSDLRDPENQYERLRWHRLLQVYVPVRQQDNGRIIGVIEFYQLPDAVDHEVATARWHAWAVVGAVMAGMYLLLIGVVKQGSDTIRRQERALGKQVSDLSELLEQNNRLNERLRRAAGRTTALNEQTLRRISADLHDGPGQALGLALLRLDTADGSQEGPPAFEEVEAVRGAVQSALAEIRAISAGLRMPELESRSPRAIAERAVHEHEQRSGTQVRLVASELPEEASLPTKIALFRSLQEALSNATRHGGGADVVVRLWAEGRRLHMSVSDRGPGFVPDDVPTDGHLGLAGIRERAELLGGEFMVKALPGQGTILQVCWPLQ